MRIRTALLLATALLLSLPASPALAADPCTTTGGNHVDVTFTPGVGPFFIYLDPAGTYNLDYFDSTGTFLTDTCDGLTSAAVTSVTVTGDVDGNAFFMDLGGPGGPFPLSTPFTVALGGALDTFVAQGTNGPDSFILGPYTPFGGTFSLDRNGDGVAEDQILTTEFFELYGVDGDDLLSGAGGGGGNFLGSPLSLVLFGGRGKDTLTGGDSNDFIYGEIGRDKMYGGKGKDRLFGGRGRDRMWGQAGKDRLVGAGGADRIFGGPGPDRLYGEGGGDHLYGGGGSDYCNGGSGTNTTAGCESFGGGSY